MLQSIFADSRSKHRPLGKDDPTSKRQAFPMLKHHCSALLTFLVAVQTPLFTFDFPPMLKHHCSTLLTSDAETPLFNTFDFPPMLKHHCSTLLTFFITETPLFTTLDFPLLLKHCYHQPHTYFPHHCSTTFYHFPPFSHRRNNTVQQLFHLFFSVAETPLAATFHHFPHC
jgi:hypothetical protein